MWLEKIEDNLTLVDITAFLNNHKKSFLNVVGTTECKKWSKWLARNETPFPCVCPTRNENCIFAEVYYELSKVAEIFKFEKDCEDAILDFQVIKNDNYLLNDWIKQFENLYTKISCFKNIITITIYPEPYEKLNINISFPTIIEDFKSTYSNAVLAIQ